MYQFKLLFRQTSLSDLRMKNAFCANFSPDYNFMSNLHPLLVEWKNAWLSYKLYFSLLKHSFQFFLFFFLSVILSSLFHILCVSSTFIHISCVKIYKTETIAKAKKILFNEWSLKILEDFLIKTKNVRMFLGKREWSKRTMLLYFTMFKNNFANNHAQKVTY